MTEIKAWACHGPKQKLERFSYNPGPLGPEEVEIAVEYCGLCHSDFSIINNEWGMSQYPVVPGHEATGCIVAIGEQAKGLQMGQRVGVDTLLKHKSAMKKIIVNLLRLVTCKNKSRQMPV